MSTENANLQGKGVLITRPIAQAKMLAEKIRKQGAHPLVYPTLSVHYASRQALLQKIQKIHSKDILVFVSINAVQGVFQHTDIQKKLLNHALAVIGASTKKCLEAYGLKATISPENDRQHSEGLLQHASLRQIEGQTIFIFRAQSGRDCLADTFKTRGAKVRYIEVYKRSLPQDFDRGALLSEFAQAKIHVILLTSFTAYQNLMKLLDDSALLWIMKCKLVVPSVRIKNLIRAEHEFSVYVASNASDEQMLYTANKFIA